MRYYTIVFFMTLSHIAFAQENYTLTIDGKTFDMSLEKKYELKINGQDAIVKLSQKETLTFDHEKFSFQYPKKFSITRSKIDKEIEQIMLMNSLGSGVLIQVYSTMDPAAFKTILLNEVIKESVSYGADKSSRTIKRTISSGEKLEVKEVTLDYKGDKSMYEIASHSNEKDEGIIMLTINSAAGDKDFDGKQVIDMFWNTFKAKK